MKSDFIIFLNINWRRLRFSMSIGMFPVRTTGTSYLERSVRSPCCPIVDKLERIILLQLPPHSEIQEGLQFSRPLSLSISHYLSACVLISSTRINHMHYPARSLDHTHFSLSAATLLPKSACTGLVSTCSLLRCLLLLLSKAFTIINHRTFVAFTSSALRSAN